MPMSSHPFHDVAISGVFNTEQARVLEGENSMSISFKAAFGALADAGLGVRDIDGVVGQFANDFVYQGRLSPAWVSSSWQGVPAVLHAAAAGRPAALSALIARVHSADAATAEMTARLRDITE